MVATELFDHHGHLVSYLRLAVTDRCNLHCFYGIPEERVQSLPKKKLLAFEEIERLITLMVPKVRLTGGEPFVPVTTDGVSAAGLKEVLKLKKEGNMMHGDGVDVNPSRLI